MKKVFFLAMVFLNGCDGYQLARVRHQQNMVLGERLYIEHKIQIYCDGRWWEVFSGREPTK